MVTSIINMFKSLMPAYEALYNALNSSVIDLLPEAVASVVSTLINFTGALPIVGNLLGGLQSFVWYTPLFEVIFVGLFAFLGYQLVIWILNIIT